MFYQFIYFFEIQAWFLFRGKPKLLLAFFVHPSLTIGILDPYLEMSISISRNVNRRNKIVDFLFIKLNFFLFSGK